jgi:hypothetical protein
MARRYRTCNSNKYQPHPNSTSISRTIVRPASVVASIPPKGKWKIMPTHLELSNHRPLCADSLDSYVNDLLRTLHTPSAFLDSSTKIFQPERVSLVLEEQNFRCSSGPAHWAGYSGGPGSMEAERPPFRVSPSACKGIRLFGVNEETVSVREEGRIYIANHAPRVGMLENS